MNREIKKPLLSLNFLRSIDKSNAVFSLRQQHTQGQQEVSPHTFVSSETASLCLATCSSVTSLQPRQTGYEAALQRRDTSHVSSSAAIAAKAASVASLESGLQKHNFPLKHFV